MANPPSLTRIRKDDYASEYQDLIETLASSLNSFMEETVNLFTGKIDFQNLKQNIVEISIETNGSGNIIQNSIIQTGLTSSINGIICIKVNNKTNQSVYPTASPFISFTNRNDNKIEILNITGLPINSKLNLTLLLIPN